MAYGACPSGYGTACESRCSTSSATVTCDLSGAGGASEAYAVTDYSLDYDIEIWGEYDGDAFCCEYNQVDEVILIGTDYADSLYFTYSGLTYNLADYDTTDVTGEIKGGGANDTIRGSHSNDIDETLRGEAGDDTILGNGGADYLYGGDNDDTLSGGNGDDWLYGDAGEDTLNGNGGDDFMYGGDDGDIMDGGPGDDFMYGQGGADRMSGGPDDDDLDGGVGADILCGDGESAGGGDRLYDGDGTAESPNGDILYAHVAADTDECGGSNTKWDGNAVDWAGQCAGHPTQTSRPSACP